MRLDSLGNAVRFRMGYSINGTLVTRGSSNGVVITLKATGSQIVIRIINDDMRIRSTITEGVLCGKS